MSCNLQIAIYLTGLDIYILFTCLDLLRLMNRESTFDTYDNLFLPASDHAESVRQEANAAVFANQALSFRDCGQVYQSTLHQAADANVSSHVHSASALLHEEHDEQQIVLQLPSGQKASETCVVFFSFDQTCLLMLGFFSMMMSDKVIVPDTR